MFPDAAPLHLSRIQAALERAGLETEHVEGFGSDYAATLRHWLERLESRPEEAVRLAGAERMRVWRLYLRAARRGFEKGFMSVYQVRGPGGRLRPRTPDPQTRSRRPSSAPAAARCRRHRAAVRSLGRPARRGRLHDPQARRGARRVRGPVPRHDAVPDRAARGGAGRDHAPPHAARGRRQGRLRPPPQDAGGDLLRGLRARCSSSWTKRSWTWTAAARCGSHQRWCARSGTRARDDAQLLIFSLRVANVDEDAEIVENFWPE